MDNNDKQLVGLQMPHLLHQQLKLATAVFQKSRSAFIRDAINWYLEINDYDCDYLIAELSKKYQTKWLTYKSEHIFDTEAHLTSAFKSFKNNIRQELKTNEIDDSIIDKILDFEL